MTTQSVGAYKGLVGFKTKVGKMNTSELLDAVKDRLDLPSDYALAKYLGISHQRVYKLRSSNGHLGDEAALKVAEALDLDPGRFLVEVHAARTKCPAARKALEQVADKVGMAVIAALVGLSGVGQAPPAGAAQEVTVTSPEYTLCAIRRGWLWRGVVRFFRFWRSCTLRRLLAAHSPSPTVAVGV